MVLLMLYIFFVCKIARFKIYIVEKINKLRVDNSHLKPEFIAPSTNSYVIKMPTLAIVISTILDINCCTNVKCGQKVLFRKRAKSAYF